MKAIISARLSIDSGTIDAGSSVGKTYTSTGTSKFYNIQKVGTTYEPLDFQDLTSCKVLYVENDSTSSVQLSMTNDNTKVFSTLGPNTSGSYFTLLPTSASAATGIYAKSSAGIIDLIVSAFEV